MKEIVDYLHEEGFSPIAPNYNFLRDIRKTVVDQAENIDALCQKHGERVSLIGHSQGGLVATSIAQERPDLVDTVLTLGAPFKGTVTAYLNYAVPSCRQMVPGSKFLKELNGKGFPKDVRFISICSTYDHLIIPWEDAKLPVQENTANFIVTEEGHARLIECHELIAGILEKRVEILPKKKYNRAGY